MQNNVANTDDACDVSIILIGLNAKQYVLECIESILAATWRNISYEIIYIDNGSKDASVEAVEKEFSDDIKVLANPDNIGFCPAANQGAKVASGEYLYFINDDTLVLEDAIALTVEHIKANPTIGTVGSRLVFPDRTDQYSGRLFPDIYSSIFGRRSFLTKMFPNIKPVSNYLCKEQLAAGQPFQVDWVSAAGQVVSAKDFSAVNGYAEDYYYWHEAVFCHRLKNAGKKIVLHPKSVVIHYEGKGSGPRAIKAQRFHIIDFHVGAYRAYCEWYSLSKFSVTKIFIGSALFLRGLALFVLAHLRSFLSNGKK